MPTGDVVVSDASRNDGDVTTGEASRPFSDWLADTCRDHTGQSGQPPQLPPPPPEQQPETPPTTEPLAGLIDTIPEEETITGSLVLFNGSMLLIEPAVADANATDEAEPLTPNATETPLVVSTWAAPPRNDQTSIDSVSPPPTVTPATMPIASAPAPVVVPDADQAHPVTDSAEAGATTLVPQSGLTPPPETAPAPLVVTAIHPAPETPDRPAVNVPDESTPPPLSDLPAPIAQAPAPDHAPPPTTTGNDTATASTLVATPVTTPPKDSVSTDAEPVVIPLTPPTATPPPADATIATEPEATVSAAAAPIMTLAPAKVEIQTEPPAPASNNNAPITAVSSETGTETSSSFTGGNGQEHPDSTAGQHHQPHAIKSTPESGPIAIVEPPSTIPSAPATTAPEPAAPIASTVRVMDPATLVRNLDQFILRSVRGEQSTMRIELEPIALGRVMLLCRQTGDGLSVQLTVQNQDIRSLLSGQEQDLRDSLATQGFQLGQFSVSCRDGDGRRGGKHEQQPNAWESQAGTNGTMSTSEPTTTAPLRPAFGGHNRWVA